MPLDGGTRLEITLKDMARRFTSGVVSAGLYDSVNATKGYLNEYGHVNDDGTITPPRSFMHTTLAFNREAWLEVLRAQFQAGRSSREALRTVGQAMASSIEETLFAAPSLFQGNAPRTIKRKGFDYPLTETGQMFKAVSYRTERVRS